MSKRTARDSTNRHHRGKIVIISSPSGGGKTSICRRLLSPARKKKGWTFSVSYTTRQRRTGERDGHAYRFVSDKQFDRLVETNSFAEWCHVHLYKYGTPRRHLDEVRRKGGVAILDVDVQGAMKLRNEYKDAISIFVLPPSIRDLKKRLRRRGTETAEQLRVRSATALKEMKSFQAYGFEYVVINKELDSAVREVLAIITAHRCRLEYMNQELVRSITG